MNDTGLPPSGPLIALLPRPAFPHDTGYPSAGCVPAEPASVSADLFSAFPHDPCLSKSNASISRCAQALRQLRRHWKRPLQIESFTQGKQAPHSFRLALGHVAHTTKPVIVNEGGNLFTTSVPQVVGRASLPALRVIVGAQRPPPLNGYHCVWRSEVILI